MAGQTVLRERHGSSLVLTFNRPEKLNAISTEMLDELEAAMTEAEGDGDVRTLVLTGAGPKAFVAGADIGEYSGQSEEQFVRYQQRSRDLFTRLALWPGPVVGAINGYALGGGFEIALCCDVLVASPNARFGLPEGLLGVSPGGGGTQRLTRAVGPYVAARVLLAADRLTAEEARALGLVAAVVDQPRLLEAALDLAARAARVAPLAAAEMKRLIRAAPEADLEAGLTLEHEALFRLFRSADAAEGIRAFVEKREPRFEGR